MIYLTIVAQISLRTAVNSESVIEIDLIAEDITFKMSTAVDTTLRDTMSAVSARKEVMQQAMQEGGFLLSQSNSPWRRIQRQGL